MSTNSQADFFFLFVFLFFLDSWPVEIFSSKFDSAESCSSHGSSYENEFRVLELNSCKSEPYHNEGSFLATCIESGFIQIQHFNNSNCSGENNEIENIIYNSCIEDSEGKFINYVWAGECLSKLYFFSYFMKIENLFFI